MQINNLKMIKLWHNIQLMLMGALLGLIIFNNINQINLIYNLRLIHNNKIKDILTHLMLNNINK